MQSLDGPCHGNPWIPGLAPQLAGSDPRLPSTGTDLPPEEFERRHPLLLGFLWLQLPVLALYAALRGYGPVHLVLHALPIALLALAASAPIANQRVRASAVALGLLTASAVAVHISGGLIETHFYFFVMIVLLTLYEDWVPFLLALGFVVLHHGVFGVLARNAVYDHGGSPWLWAGVHGGFVLLAGASAVLAWRLNEDVRAREAEARRALQLSEGRFRTLTESAPVGIFETDVDGKCVYVNERLCELTGLERPEARGAGAEPPGPA
jgi:PAS domain-containing protein